MSERAVCPCCGHRSLDGDQGDYLVCGICAWEDDPVALRYPFAVLSGPNGTVSLHQAQRNYADLGASSSDVHTREHTRAPRPDEGRDPGWRPVDPDRDLVETDPDHPLKPDPADPRALYWWLPTYFGRDDYVAAPPAQHSGPLHRAVRRVLADAPASRDVYAEALRHAEDPHPGRVLESCLVLALRLWASGDAAASARLVDGVFAEAEQDPEDFLWRLFHDTLGDRAEQSEGFEAFVGSWPAFVRGLALADIGAARAERRNAETRWQQWWEENRDSIPPGTRFSG